MTEEDATKKTLAEMAAMVPGGAEALLERAARLSRHREEGASSDSPAAVEGETRRRDSRRAADLEDRDDDSSDDDASADALLEVAIELALVAAALADRDANDARVSLAACAEAARVDDGFDAAAAARESSSPRDRSRSPASSSSTLSSPPCCDAESSSALELDLERSIALHSASTALAASLRRRLGRRAIADEWAARTAATASVDFRRDRAKPRVRAKDRRCHAPKARQGWTRAAIRSERVRTCVGCDRLAEGDRMIRIARLERKEDGNDEEESAEESGAEETRRGPAARKNDDDREEDEGAGVVISKTKKGKSRRRDSHTSGRSGGGRVLAVDASSGRLPPRLLKAMIGPEGPLSALTRAHPDARSLAAEMVSSATASERRRGGARLHGRGMYVCPRVHCATRAAKAKALRRHLPREKKERRKSGAGGGGERGGGGGGPREGDSSSSSAAAAASAAAASFGEALVRLCAELEAIEGVDSSGWVVTREGGAPSRWTAPPRFSDAETGAEAEEAGAFASKVTALAVSSAVE